MGVRGEETLGIYVSMPFCKAKCSFCNFASGVFGPGAMPGYLERVSAEMEAVRGFAEGLGMELPGRVDSIYLGGGTPSLLEPGDVERLFGELRGEFAVDCGAEITVECAPGQVSDRTLEALLRAGVNRLSFGVQSFVDAECAATGRLHTGRACREELARMERAGVGRLGLDLVVGLPHQTEASWRYSVEQAMESGVEHVSVYLLEVDEDSRLGREALAGGTRYGAAALPEDDRAADWYQAACEWLEGAGVKQYEISNFARLGGQSRHNRKYWERGAYVGFGLDAHSMLRGGTGGVRWANAEEMGGYLGPGMGERGFQRTVDRVGSIEAFEEAVFLGLRLVEGVELAELRREFGGELVGWMLAAAEEMVEVGWVRVEDGWVRLTGRGRLVSNEVFGRLLMEEDTRQGRGACVEMQDEQRLEVA